VGTCRRHRLQLTNWRSLSTECKSSHKERGGLGRKEVCVCKCVNGQFRRIKQKLGDKERGGRKGRLSKTRASQENGKKNCLRRKRHQHREAQVPNSRRDRFKVAILLEAAKRRGHYKKTPSLREWWVIISRRKCKTKGGAILIVYLLSRGL